MPEWLKNLMDRFGAVESKLDKLTPAEDQVNRLKAQLDAANAKAAAAEETLVNLSAELETVRGTVAGKDAEIATLNASLETEKRRVTETLAAQGLNQADIPAAVAGNVQTVSEQVAELRKRLIQSADPAEKFRLSNQIRELLSKKN